MNKQDKIAIENLIIISHYIGENSILTSKDENLLADSIARAERLIGKAVERPTNEIYLADIGEFDVDTIIDAIKNRKKP